MICEILALDKVAIIVRSPHFIFSFFRSRHSPPFSSPFFLLIQCIPSIIAESRNACSIKAAAVSTAVAATGASPLLSVVAVVVGWLVIGGSLFRSIPQIARIIKKQRYDFSFAP
jgi:hypothetical protein